MLRIVYSIPFFRERICRIRFFFFLKFKELSTGSLNSVLHSEYSKVSIKTYNSNKNRITYLVKLLENISSTPSVKKVLSCGPRFESELYGYRSLGFRWRNIIAIDTFSYSNKIQLGNIHALDFIDNSFDYIVAGWVIAYSENPVAAVKELTRVLKRGGKLLITWDVSEKNLPEKLGDIYLPRINNMSERYEIADKIFLSDFLVDNLKVERMEFGFLEKVGTSSFVALVLKK